MDNNEVLLKPIRTRVDAVMMATVVFLFLVTVVLGLFYDQLSLSLAIGIPALIIPFLVWRALKGTLVSRLSMASALIIQIAIQIQISHGLIEMHFGLFVVLAFLLAYRDWRPIVFGAALIATQHLVGNFLQASQLDEWIFHHDEYFGIASIVILQFL